MQAIDSPHVAAVTPTLARTTRDTAPQPPRLLDQLRAACRVQHFSLRTEQAYAHWVKRYVLWSGKRHPATLGGPEVEAFLTYLATERDVSASTQRQALSALLFLYRQVLGLDLPWLANITRAKQPQRIPVWLTEQEVARLWRHAPPVTDDAGLVLRLLYGSGLRLMEALRLRDPGGSGRRYRIVLALAGKAGDSVAPSLRCVDSRQAVKFSKQLGLHSGAGSGCRALLLSGGTFGGADGFGSIGGELAAQPNSSSVSAADEALQTVDLGMCNLHGLALLVAPALLDRAVFLLLRGPDLGGLALVGLPLGVDFGAALLAADVLGPLPHAHAGGGDGHREECAVEQRQRGGDHG